MAGKNDDWQGLDVLPKGSALDAAARGSLAVNMLRRRNAWETRDGFGQMAQFDTQLGVPRLDNLTGAQTWGYEKILGSTAFLTNFGHVQIITVLLARVQIDSVAAIGNYLLQYVVNIYDATSNLRHEEPLFQHTAATVHEPDMPRAAMFWRDQPDPQGQASVSAVDEDITFSEYEDCIILTGAQMGIWCYRPCDFGGGREQVQTDSWRGTAGWQVGIPLGESSRITPIVAADGLFPEAYPYLPTLPQAPISTVMGDVLVYAEGRTVYFAENLKPGSIPSVQILALPVQDEITAIASNNGYLYVFTSQELGVYQPGSQGPTPGQLTMLSNGIGCIAQELVERVDSTLFWVSKVGMFKLDSPMSMVRVSDPVRPLFDESVGNPITNYYQNSGADEYSAAQARIAWDTTDMKGATLTWEPVRRCLLLSVPSQNYVLVYQPLAEDTWHFWTFDSIVQPDSAVAVSQRIQNIRFHAINQRLFAVCGIEGTIVSESIFDFVGGSYIVLEWGRGGGLDRSVYETEDDRQLRGRWDLIESNPTENSAFIVGKPVRQPAGYILPNTTVSDVPVVLVPVSIVLNPDLGTSGNVGNFFFKLTGIDATRFEPVSGTIPVMLGPERIPSRFGYVSSSWNPGTGELVIEFDSSGVAGPDKWSFWPHLNISRNDENPLFWLVLRDLATTNEVNYGPLLNAVGTKFRADTISAWRVPYVYQWVQGFLNAPHTDDDVAQPVDWLVKTAQIGLKGVEQLRTRGVAMRILSRGRSSDGLVAGFVHGLLNVSVAADWKDWATQIVDFQNGGTRVVEKKAARGDIQVHDTINAISNPQGADFPMRSRLGGSTAYGPVPAMFNGTATWGDTTDAAAGNILTGDEDYDTMAVSTAVRGEHVSWMFFGHVQNRAEKLVLDTAKAFIRNVGALRRFGR